MTKRYVDVSSKASTVPSEKCSVRNTDASRHVKIRTTCCYCHACIDYSQCSEQDVGENWKMISIDTDGRPARKSSS